MVLQNRLQIPVKTFEEAECEEASANASKKLEEEHQACIKYFDAVFGSEGFQRVALYETTHISPK